MTSDWDTVDHYIDEVLGLGDPLLEAALAGMREGGLPEIQVAPAQGKLLHVLAVAVGARRVLEVGTLGGYSAIWLARALPEHDPTARMITLEIDPRHAAVARESLDRAGFAQQVEIRVGPALDSLAQLHAEGAEPFDVVFIDADKVNNAHYFDWAVDHTRVGGLIVVDNVVRGGAVADAASTDPAVVGTRALFAQMAAEPRVSATAVQTVGVKGYDGLAVAVVVAP